jgi:Ca2+-binding EF-hand superfamily protein
MAGEDRGAPKNSQDQNRSTIFDLSDHQTGTMMHRKGGDDSEIQTKPFGKEQTAQKARAPAAEVPTFGRSAFGIAPPSPFKREATSTSIADRMVAQAEDPEHPARHVEEILESMRTALRMRGAVGLKGLAKNFQICDRTKDRKLQRDELDKCIKMCKLQLEPDEFDALFAHCDSNESGDVDYEEFLQIIRGPMPVRRKKLVVSIFNRIDMRQREGGRGVGDGALTVDDLKDVYDASEHPDVKAGKKHESAVLQEMMQRFEGKGGNRDGVVSLDEWIGYYEELSASVEDDDHFNQLVSGAWAPLFKGADPLPMPPKPELVDQIESRLVEAIRARSRGTSETRALELTFKAFDLNKSGTVDFDEFSKAMERFGLATSEGGVGGGCSTQLLLALFDRYDPEGDGYLSYQEFIKGLAGSSSWGGGGGGSSARGGGGGAGGGPGSPPKQELTSLELTSEPPTANPLGSFSRGRGSDKARAANDLHIRIEEAATALGPHAVQQAIGKLEEALKSARAAQAPLQLLDKGQAVLEELGKKAGAGPGQRRIVRQPSSGIFG